MSFEGNTSSEGDGNRSNKDLIESQNPLKHKKATREKNPRDSYSVANRDAGSSEGANGVGTSLAILVGNVLVDNDLVEDLEVDLVAQDSSAVTTIDSTEVEHVLGLLEEVEVSLGKSRGLVCKVLVLAVEVGANLHEVSFK